MTRATKPIVQPAELEAPIINSPFEPPRCHWHIVRGEPPEKREGRRRARYFFRVPEHAARGRSGKSKQIELIAEAGKGEEEDLDLVNTVRKQVQAWRERGYDGATGVTRELLALWRREDRGQQLFFAQLEAAETLIFLVEGPADLRKGIKVPFDSPGPQARGAGSRPFVRHALKMATGSGKTTVMGMLAAWSILNAAAAPKDKRFSDTILIICPNVTIRDRLQERADHESGC